MLTEPLCVAPLEVSIHRPRRHRNVRSQLKWLYVISAGTLLLLITPTILYALASQQAAVRQFLLPLAASFVCCAAPMSLFGIWSHVTNYWQPTLQKYVVRILWMVPVYSVTSLAELLLWLRVEKGHTAAAKWCVVPRAARDCYESYTVLNFFYFMLAFLELSDGQPAAVVLSTLKPNGKRRRRRKRSYVPVNASDDDLESGPSDDDDLESGPSDSSSSSVADSSSCDDDDDSDDSDDDDDDERAVAHPCPPYRCACSGWRLDNGEFLEKTRYGVLLYATLMPLCALALIASAVYDSQTPSDDDDGGVELAGGDDDDVWQRAYNLLTPANVAAFVQFNAANHAIYCLAIFYYVAHGLLAPCHPHLKFVAVKGIVFGTFFQNLGIDAVFFAKPSLARAFSTGDDAQVNAALGSVQSTLMCVEMLAFAILHAKAFPWRDFPRVYRSEAQQSQQPQQQKTQSAASLQGLELLEEKDEAKSDDDEKSDDEDWVSVAAPRPDDDDAPPGVSRPAHGVSSPQGEGESWKKTAHVSARSRAWLAAWGDFYAHQKAERLIRPSRLIFDVSDVHRDTSATLSGLHLDVTNPILANHSTSLFARTLARLRTRASPDIAVARFASSRAGAGPLV